MRTAAPLLYDSPCLYTQHNAAVCFNRNQTKNFIAFIKYDYLIVVTLV